MKKFKDTFISLFHRFFDPFLSALRHPIVSAKAYAAEMKTLDTKGKVIKLLKTAGFILGLIALACVCYWLLILAVTLVLGIFLAKVIIGGGIFEHRYNRMIEEDDGNEYYYEK